EKTAQNDTNTHAADNRAEVTGQNTAANNTPDEKPASSDADAGSSPAAPQAQPTGSYSYTRENIPENVYRPAQPGQNPGYNPYMQNGQTSGGQYGQNPYGQQNSQPNAPFSQNSQNNGQYGAPNGGFQNNPYAQHNQNPYGYQQTNGGQPGYDPTGYSPVQDGSRISYAPDKKAAKKAKKGSGKKAAVAVACCCGLLLSTGFGFLGAVIAGRLLPSSAPAEELVVDTEGNVVNDTMKTAVFYKSVENLSTSTGENGGDLTLAQVSAMVGDTVVEITTEFVNTSNWFQYVSTGAGSGVILSQDGYVITNNHVICGDDGVTPADTITVRLTNGDEYKAELIGTDSDSDIAVLKIDAQGLTPAVCGNSDNLVVGEAVLAVGNPLGELGGTQTEGIISALDREIDVNGVSMTLLQTSAAVNPGNSGGALFNMRGELIGVVNAKSSGTGIEGLGFAIPINDALNVSEQLMEYGYVRGKVAIGVSFYECTDALEARYYGLPGYGVYVMELSKGYNENVLQVLDRIISIDGEEISSFSDISSIIKSHSVGDVLKFQISRNGKIMEVDVTCYEKVPAGMGEVEFEEN
ncbi:MAG: trypsin-like peptidase domain-containing protein, partial [Clostridia bacterium]|nr:trypsin-like peptidase domain-containing protein [Clostridia bacterium]